LFVFLGPFCNECIPYPGKKTFKLELNSQFFNAIINFVIQVANMDIVINPGNVYVIQIMAGYFVIQVSFSIDRMMSQIQIKNIKYMR
jgi:hypothetical protein